MRRTPPRPTGASTFRPGINAINSTGTASRTKYASLRNSISGALTNSCHNGSGTTTRSGRWHFCTRSASKPVKRRSDQISDHGEATPHDHQHRGQRQRPQQPAQPVEPVRQPACQHQLQTLDGADQPDHAGGEDHHVDQQRHDDQATDIAPTEPGQTAQSVSIAAGEISQQCCSPSRYAATASSLTWHPATADPGPRARLAGPRARPADRPPAHRDRDAADHR